MSAFSKRNEVKAWEYISFIATESYENYPTTLTQDKEILKDNE